jgi:hypothetical protein
MFMRHKRLLSQLSFRVGYVHLCGSASAGSKAQNRLTVFQPQTGVEFPQFFTFLATHVIEFTNRNPKWLFTKTLTQAGHLRVLAGGTVLPEMGYH